MNLDVALMLVALALYSGAESPLGDIAVLHGPDGQDAADGTAAAFKDHAEGAFIRLEQQMLWRGPGAKKWIYGGLRSTMAQ